MAVVQVRATSHFGFRPGEWADLVGFAWHEPVGRPGRPCYRVRFRDGVEDLWPIRDDLDAYEFRQGRVELGDHAVVERENARSSGR